MSVNLTNRRAYVAVLMLFGLLALASVGSAQPPDPCVVQDDGSGTVHLPPPGCEYLSPAEVHLIIDGLPPGTTIELDPIHQHFFCPPPGCGRPGGNLGGNVEMFDSIARFDVEGTGALAGFNRTLEIPLVVETHTSPPTPSTGGSQIETDMFQLQGELFGDPDFAQLQIRGGTNLVQTSPGLTILSPGPGNDFVVDSFFDITYQIDFVGAPGGALDGLFGTTEATIRMEAADDPTVDPVFTDGFESGNTSSWSNTQPPLIIP